MSSFFSSSSLRKAGKKVNKSVFFLEAVYPNQLRQEEEGEEEEEVLVISKLSRFFCLSSFFSVFLRVRLSRKSADFHLPF